MINMMLKVGRDDRQFSQIPSNQWKTHCALVEAFQSTRKVIKIIKGHTNYKYPLPTTHTRAHIHFILNIILTKVK